MTAKAIYRQAYHLIRLRDRLLRRGYFEVGFDEAAARNFIVKSILELWVLSGWDYERFVNVFTGAARSWYLGKSEV